MWQLQMTECHLQGGHGVWGWAGQTQRLHAMPRPVARSTASIPWPTPSPGRPGARRKPHLRVVGLRVNAGVHFKQLLGATCSTPCRVIAAPLEPDHPHPVRQLGVLAVGAQRPQSGRDVCGHLRLAAVDVGEAFDKGPGARRKSGVVGQTGSCVCRVLLVTSAVPFPGNRQLLRRASPRPMYRTRRCTPALGLLSRALLPPGPRRSTKCA
jgi:hypothetical protein